MALSPQLNPNHPMTHSCPSPTPTQVGAQLNRVSLPLGRAVAKSMVVFMSPFGSVCNAELPQPYVAGTILSSGLTEHFRRHELIQLPRHHLIGDIISLYG